MPSFAKSLKEDFAAHGEITAEKLEVEGWEYKPGGNWIIEHWIRRIDSDTTIKVIVRGDVFLEKGVFLHYGDRDFDYIYLPGVRNMADLRTLVRLLGGIFQKERSV